MTGVLFSNFVAANKESQAIVAMYNDPTSPDNAGKFLAAARSWDRVSRRNAARAAWLAGEAARRAGNDRLAIKILRTIEPEVRASGRKPLLRRIHATLRVRLHPADGGAPEEIRGRVLAMVPLRNRRQGVTTRIAEGLTEWRWGDRVGYGWSEYLDHVG